MDKNAPLSVDNQFTRIVRRYRWLPARLQRTFTSLDVGRTIPFVGTAGLAIDTLHPHKVSVRLKNRRRVRNHIGGLHAGAMALLAETATGLVVALNVAGHCAPLIRTLNVSFKRHAEGPLRARATLSADEAERIRTSDVGKVDVPIEVTDASGQEPIDCDVQWAWLPKRRIPALQE